MSPRRTGTIAALSNGRSSIDAEPSGLTASAVYAPIVLDFSRAMNRLADRYLEKESALRPDEVEQIESAPPRDPK